MCALCCNHQRLCRALLSPFLHLSLFSMIPLFLNQPWHSLTLSATTFWEHKSFFWFCLLLSASTATPMKPEIADTQTELFTYCTWPRCCCMSAVNPHFRSNTCCMPNALYSLFFIQSNPIRPKMLKVLWNKTMSCKSDSFHSVFFSQRFLCG